MLAFVQEHCESLNELQDHVLQRILVSLIILTSVLDVPW